MRPWEETWRWDDDAKRIVRDAPGAEDDVERDYGVVVETDSGVYPPREADRKLIVAAPELARALLTVEAASLASASACPVCRGPYVEDMRGGPYRASAGYVIDHAFDCPLDAALRKAGVR